MTIQFIRCTNDEDLAKVSLFFLENKDSLHPAFTTMDMVSLMYAYLTQGHLVQVMDADNRVIGAAAYYHGTPEQEFQDKEVAFVDIAIFEKARRGTLHFIKGLRYLANQIAEQHPEVQELRLAALSENDYLCRLYAKFATASSTRAGMIGEETVFRVKINKLMAILTKYDKV